MTESPDSLKVTAYLVSPLAGPAPILDSLLEWAMCVHVHGGNETRWKVDRRFPAPDIATIPIPLVRERIGGWSVACCSSPILPAIYASTVEHITKRIAVEHSDLLAPEERRQVNTTGFWTKSYRLPLDVRRVEKVVWFARGNRKGLVDLLKQVHAIGQRPAKGYGRVLRWEVDKGAPDAWWFAEDDAGAGTVLMRPLPKCAELPRDLIGFREYYGACCPPYWHPDRYGDIVEPV